MCAIVNAKTSMRDVRDRFSWSRKLFVLCLNYYTFTQQRTQLHTLEHTHTVAKKKKKIPKTIGIQHEHDARMCAKKCVCSNVRVLHRRQRHRVCVCVSPECGVKLIKCTEAACETTVLCKAFRAGRVRVFPPARLRRGGHTEQDGIDRPRPASVNSSSLADLGNVTLPHTCTPKIHLNSDYEKWLRDERTRKRVCVRIRVIWLCVANGLCQVFKNK